MVMGYALKFDREAPEGDELSLKHIGRERHASDKRHASRVIRVSNHFSSFHIA